MKTETPTLSGFAAALHEMANQATRLQARLLLPLTEQLDLAGAIERLAAVLAPDSFTLDISIKCYDGTPTVSYDVWDSGRNQLHRAQTLSGAVNLTLLARTPPPADPLAQAGALIEGQMAKQELEAMPF